MSFPRYEHYKDSGVEWLGEVPAGWEIVRLKNIASVNMGQSPKSEDCNQDGDGIPFLQGNADFGDHNPTPRYFCTTANKFAQNGDVLLSVRAPVGAINIANQIYGIGRGLCAITANTETSRGYLYYALGKITEELFSVATGSTYEAVSAEQVGNARCFSPPAKEQHAIAAFLDRETAKIDALIAEQQRLIALLSEKRQAVISHAVTKGLNPDAPMKDSGIEWLGEVPAGWEVTRLANLFKEVDERGDEGLPVLCVSIHSGISDRELDEEEMDRKVSRSEDRSIYKQVMVGDLVYNMMRAWQGAFGAAKVNGMVSPAYVVARPRRPLITTHIELLLRTPQAIEQMRRHSKGVTDFRLRLYWDEFKDIRVAVPPYEEAEAICAHVEKVVSGYENLSFASQQVIALLKERRTALISAAVTGKIDLRSS